MELMFDKASDSFVENKRKKLKVSKDDTGGREREHFPQSTFYLETFRPTLKHNKNCRVCAFFVDL